MRFWATSSCAEHAPCIEIATPEDRDVAITLIYEWCEATGRFFGDDCVTDFDGRCQCAAWRAMVRGQMFKAMRLYKESQEGIPGQPTS